MQVLRRQVGLIVMVAACAMVAACTSGRVGGAPVEDRGTASQAPLVINAAPASGLPRATIADPLVAPGYHMVRVGETLIRIGLDAGQSWKDIVRWNNLENPDRIEVGQVLRVAPPGASPAQVATAAGNMAVDSGAMTKPVVSSTVVAAPATSPASATAGASAGTAAAARAAASAVEPTRPAAAVTAAGGDDAVAFIWPSAGALISGFDEAKNKGYDISGKAGDAVLASADGRVVYAGAGLRGYGNLIILKHNNTYLTAYAHNQTLLVKDDQSVRKGQKIAEMGSTDADRVKLHFEIRKQGKPVDPSRYLPAK